MLFLQFQPHPLLRDYVDRVLVQEDWNPVNYANRNPVKVLPSTCAVIGIQYGSPMNVIEDGREKPLSGTSGLTGLQTTFKAYVSTGRVGTIIVRFKPGGLAAFTPYPIHEMQNANLDLSLLFPPRLVSEMEARVHAATDAVGRVEAVQAFLRTVIRRSHEDPLIPQIARHIQQRKGSVSIESVLRDFFVSKKTLERKFNALIGITPKRFANIVRFQHAIQLRRSGFDYLDIVEACGFSDQAHFAHDFKAFAGCSPEPFFRNEVQPELARHFNGDPLTPGSTTMYQ